MKCFYIAIGQKDAAVAAVMGVRTYGAMEYTTVIVLVHQLLHRCNTLRRTLVPPWPNTSCSMAVMH